MDLDRVIAAVRSLEDEIRALLDVKPTGQTDETVIDLAEEALSQGRLQDVVELVDQLDGRSLPPSLRTRSVLARAALEPRASAVPARSTDLLLDEAALVELDDPELAAHLLIEAAVRLSTGDDVEASLAIARRARDVAERGSPSVQALAVLTGELLATLTGRGKARLNVVQHVLAAITPDSRASAEMLHRLAVFCHWNEDYGTARTLLERLVELARSGPRALLPLALNTLAAVDLRTGRWTAAEGRSAEALRLALVLGQDWQAASCNTTLASIAAAAGREEECRRRAQAALELAPGSELVRAWTVTSLTLLELSLDRPAAATAELETLEAANRFGTSVVPLLPLRVEAYMRADRPADAAKALAVLEAHAVASRHLGTLALAARCRGLVADAGEYRFHFEEALELHTHLPTPFERARTELLFGERLRRGRHRAEAQPKLRSALATFERIGALKWSERARRELAAMRRRSAGTNALAQLTAHELEVASLVVRGATNREAATALFVAEKTIEYHLRNVYVKLGIRSRTELAQLVLRGDS